MAAHDNEGALQDKCLELPCCLCHGALRLEERIWDLSGLHLLCVT